MSAAGSGWSDLGPHDHSPGAYAQEMEAVLRIAGINGPYVLVAASYGGRVARVFTSSHPDQVLGLVFVDAAHEDSVTAPDIAAQRQQQVLFDAGNFILSRLGVARLLGPELSPFIDGPVAYKVPKATRELIAVIALRPKNLEGNTRLAASQQADDALLRANSLGDRPVMVLSSTQMLERMPHWAAGQAGLVAFVAHAAHRGRRQPSDRLGAPGPGPRRGRMRAAPRSALRTRLNRA